MDPSKFDGLIRTLSRSLSRRSLVGGSLGASVLAAVGLTDAALAKGNENNATAEACIQTGKQCSSKKPRGRSGPNTKKPKRLSCKQCCQRRVVTNTNGKTICYCAETGTACNETRECCDGICQNKVCVERGTGTGTSTGTTTPRPIPATCTAVAGVAMVSTGQANGSACTGGEPQACASGYCVAGSGCQTCPNPCVVAGASQCCGDAARCLDSNGDVAAAGQCVQCCVSSGLAAPDGCPGTTAGATGTNAACCTSTCVNGATAAEDACCAPTGSNPTRSGGQMCTNAGGAPNASCCSGFCTGANPTTSLCVNTLP